MLLGREEILGVQDLQYEEIEVWGGIVRVRMMTGSERDSFEQSIMKTVGDRVERNMENMRAKLLVRTICDENNKRIFLDRDVDVLGGKSAAELHKLFEAAQRLNKLGTDDYEGLEKNSESEASDISISASQEN